MSVEQNKAIARRFIEEVWNRGDMAVADQLLAPDLVNHDIDGTTIDRAGFLEAIVALRAANPAIRFAVDDMLAEGDRVATRVTITGAGTEGSPMTVNGIGIVRLAGGRIVEQWADTNPVASARR
jgi:predicted ester cyclase